LLSLYLAAGVTGAKMAEQSFQDRLDRLEEGRGNGQSARRARPAPGTGNRSGTGWFRWKLFLPSVVWGLFAHITVLFANMHYEQAKADFETVPQMFYIILGCAAFGLLSYLMVLFLLFRALAGRPTTYSVVLGFFIGVAVISLM